MDAVKSLKHPVPIVFFYCQSEERHQSQGLYILASFIKQLFGFLRPENIVRDVRKFFGHNRTEPDFDDLKDIFIRLFYCIPNVLFVLDGLDVLEKQQVKNLLEVFRSIFCGPKSCHGSQILLVSREQIPGYIDIATSMPGIRQISIHSNILPDIDVYIKTGIVEKSKDRKLTDDPVLLREIRRILLEKSSGMYVTNL